MNHHRIAEGYNRLSRFAPTEELMFYKLNLTLGRDRARRGTPRRASCVVVRLKKPVIFPADVVVFRERTL